MIELLQLILHIVASLFKSRARLEAEILVLRQQLNVLRRQVSKRPQLNNADRFPLVSLYRWFPSVLGAIAILRPETIIRWHRTGFRVSLFRTVVSAEDRCSTFENAQSLKRYFTNTAMLVARPVPIRIATASYFPAQN